MELIDRVTSSTPPFLKKVRNIALVIGSITGSILVSGVELTDQMNGILVIIASVAAAIAGTAQTAKADK